MGRAERADYRARRAAPKSSWRRRTTEPESGVFSARDPYDVAVRDVRIGAGSIVCVDDLNGKFTITGSAANG